MRRAKERTYINMSKDQTTFAGLKKYLSLFEKSGVYWLCLFLIPGTDVFVSALNALFYQNIINAVMASDIALFSAALWLAAVVLGVNVARSLLIYAYMYHIRQIMARLRVRVMTHLFRLPMSYFEGLHTADSIQKLCFNVEDIKTSLANRHPMIISPVIVGVSAIVLIMLLDPRIGLMVLALSIVSVKINMVLSKPLRGMAVRIQKLFTTCTERLTDILAGIDVIKIFPGACIMVKEYYDANADVAVHTMKGFRRMADVQAAEWVFSYLGNIGRAWGSLIDSFVLADRVFEVLDQPVQPENYKNENIDGDSSFSVRDCGIIMRDAVFSYDGSEKVLNGVDITVDRGKTAALVGESGGGKSTIVRLLLGFYRPNGGTISVLGKPLSDYTPDELRKNIAYVPQDAYLFTTSIKENIRYGRQDASDEEVIEAARRAYAHEFIMAFPNGYDTLVGERGESLSDGQRQRIAIARAFIRNAPILLLDEATSALDSESEQLVQKGIEALMGGRTTLVVAHRLSTIEKADMIYVIGGGKVCEQGRHTELMEQGGVYKRLVELSRSEA